MEQLMTTLHTNMRAWVQRNHPHDLEAAIQLVEDFCNAEEGSCDNSWAYNEKMRVREKMASESNAGSSQRPA